MGIPRLYGILARMVALSGGSNPILNIGEHPAWSSFDLTVGDLASEIVRTVSPSSAHSGESVTITGSYFHKPDGTPQELEVYFGNVKAAPPTILSDTQLTVRLPR